MKAFRLVGTITTVTKRAAKNSATYGAKAQRQLESFVTANNVFRVPQETGNWLTRAFRQIRRPIHHVWNEIEITSNRKGELFLAHTRNFAGRRFGGKMAQITELSTNGLEKALNESKFAPGGTHEQVVTHKLANVKHQTRNVLPEAEPKLAETKNNTFFFEKG